LQAHGVAQVFLSGTSIAEIVDYLNRESARSRPPFTVPLAGEG
jgi:hypothetical protein